MCCVCQNQQQIDLYSGKQMSLPAFRRMLAIAFHQFLPVCSVSSSASHNAVVSETARMLTPYRATHVSSIVAVFFAVAVIIVRPLVLCVVLRVSLTRMVVVSTFRRTCQHILSIIFPKIIQPATGSECSQLAKQRNPFAYRSLMQRLTTFPRLQFTITDSHVCRSHHLNVIACY